MTTREQIASIPSPSFTTVYPKIYHVERIPASIAQILEPIWQKAFYHEEPVKVFRFNDVYTAGQGLVLDTEFRVVSESVSQHTQDDFNQAIEQVKTYVAAGHIQTVKDESLLLVKPGWFNYGHWLIELLPHAFLIEKALGIAPQVFLPKAQPAVAKAQKQSLELAGVDQRRIVDYDFAPRLFKNLVMVTGHCRHGPYMSPLVFGVLDRCRSQIVGHRSGTPRRIYVKRSQSSARGITNQDEVEAYLSEKGFESINPEGLSLTEQIKLFADCEISIGVAGAGLTNIAWQRPGSACIALYPAGMPDTFFWWICQHRGIRWIDVRYPVAATRGTYDGWNGDIEVSIPDIEVIIRGVEKGGI